MCSAARSSPTAALSLAFDDSFFFIVYYYSTYYKTVCMGEDMCYKILILRAEACVD
jgi:hypothetical protein